MEQSFADLAGWAHNNAEIWLFYIIAFMAIPFAWGVLLDRNTIRCGFLLIGVFGAISGLFLLLRAQFLAMAQLMLYAVGITLVVIIALMLTNPKMERDASPTVVVHKVPGIIVAILLFATIYMALRSEIWPVRSDPMAADNVTQIGTNLLIHYSLPFEFASILLLVAVIGAIMLAKSQRASAAFNGKLQELQTKTTNSQEERKDHVVKV